MTRVVLLHGKNKNPSDVWYPWVKSECEKLHIACDVPEIPKIEPPRIADWLGVINHAQPDKDTILVGHSRGGMAILRWLEDAELQIKKAILVAANSATIIDQARGDFYSGPYDFEAIRSNCKDFTVIHSKDDRWVPYEAALENAAGLGAKLITFDSKNHFGSQADGSMMMTFPELVQEIVL